MAVPGPWRSGTAVALMVLAMVVVGARRGADGVGLSITEWKPIQGSAAAQWLTGRRSSPTAGSRNMPPLNQGMTLEASKASTGGEWAHRLLGRLVGSVFAAPFVWFLIRREIAQWLIWCAARSLAPGGLQAWSAGGMVASRPRDRDLRGLSGWRPTGPCPDPCSAPLI